MKALHFMAAVLGVYTTTAFADAPPVSPAREYTRDLLHKFDSWLDRNANERRQKARERARIVPKGATPEVSIRRTGVEPRGYPYFADGILFNGQRITINDSPSRALEVFGSEFRTYNNHYIWDHLGIEMYTYAPGYGPNPYTKVIHTISIHLNTTSEGVITDRTEPKQSFKGYLELDGAGIDRDSKLWEVRALVDRSGLADAHAYITCNDKRPVCKVPSFGKERSDEVHFWTDMDHANGKIYSVNYSFK